MTATRAVALCFALSVIGSIGLVVIYLLGGQPQLEGVFLGLALGGLGVGIVIWAVRLLEAPVMVEPRHPMAGDVDASDLPPAADLERITRRTLLRRMLAGSAAVLGAALAIPVLSLGPRQGRSLFRTAWGDGARVVGDDGVPIRPADVTLGSVRTVFPDGSVGAPDAATLLVRVDPADLRLGAGRDEWAPEGVLGYSKICTHAGCPVGLYRAEDQSLLCPCHQSTFDVLRGAVPTFGPAARPLPQLPLGVDEEGYLVATADFPEPVGPSFWNLTHTPAGPEAADDADPADVSEE